MYAVIATGGKQYRVAQGQVLRCEKLVAEVGQQIDFNEVLLVVEGEDQRIGKPFVEGAVVKAQVVDHGRDKKVKILKFKRRKHHMKRMGHRQYFTAVEITNISFDGSKQASGSAAKRRRRAAAAT